ncbi:MAG: UDP-N-acetylmuramoyl-L-alanine--D-glutamate ligase [Clostridia bacterium]|nr:UDP-N-acetylmuramoyl-L-alanine--D-glutamate ligase [Clostridia bacterium]
MDNIKLKAFEMEMNKKRITVIGIGISNLPLIKYLVTLGAEVTACDRRSAEKLGKNYDDLKSLGVNLHLGENYLDNIDAEIIFKTPGMRFDVPQLNAARENGCIVTSEMEVFFELCPSHIIGVTGSDGKTTTTTLIYKMLEKQGYKTWLGGNIGNPLLTSVGEMNSEDYVVLELSSFQLHTMRQSPEIAVITNISPNHLDMHKDYQEYIDAKKNIMLYQNADNILVTNSGNDVTRQIGEASNGKCRYFSSKNDALIHLANDAIYYGDDEVLKLKDIKIPGMHNAENYMAAIGAVHDLVSIDTINNIAKSFGGVEHRIELVRELDGVKYYNSSIDSSPNRTINTLKVFKNKVIMIAGGKDKGIPYNEIGEPIINGVKTLILIGATSGVIEDAVNKAYKRLNIEPCVQILHADEYDKAVMLAKNCAKSGDIVLLSPASTSFDMFNNFEERGNLFKKLVNEL